MSILSACVIQKRFHLDHSLEEDGAAIPQSERVNDRLNLATVSESNGLALDVTNGVARSDL